MDYIEVLFLLWIVCASCGACAHGGIHGQGCLHGCLIVLLLSAFFVLDAVCGVWRFVSQPFITAPHRIEHYEPKPVWTRNDFLNQ